MPAPDILNDSNWPRFKGFGKKVSETMVTGPVVLRYGKKIYFIGEMKQNKKQGFGYHLFPNDAYYIG